MIRLRKTAVAAAIEDVAAAREQQSGSYQGPRVLSDEPARAVVDLAAYRPPVRPRLINEEIVLTSGDRLFFDVHRGDTGSAAFVSAAQNKEFGFARFFRVGTFNSGGTSGNYDVELRILSDFDPPAAPGTNRRIQFTRVGAGTAQVFQYGFDAQDQAASNTEIILPDGLVTPPDVRLVIDVDNQTDDDLDVEIFSWAYLFGETDLLI